MNVLIVGSGQGSWEIRGRQLGAAIGARVTSNPSVADLSWAHVIVLVKHAITAWGARATATGARIVWDALDFWRQPGDNALSESQSRDLLHARMLGCVPDLVIGATEAMARAAGGVYLRHHARPGVTVRPVRASVATVAYEGAEAYLGRWAGWLSAACHARGWSFVVNPRDVSESDILVAFRDGQWDGWMCREWKSGVKVANAIAAGRPILMQESASWRELQPIGSLVETRADLESALDAWAPYETRAAVPDDAAVAQCSLPVVAEAYRACLEAVACHA